MVSVISDLVGSYWVRDNQYGSKERRCAPGQDVDSQKGTSRSTSSVVAVPHLGSD